MGQITEVEKRYFERLLDMGSGYVLDFTNPTFSSFFLQHGVNIYSRQYETYGLIQGKTTSRILGPRTQCVGCEGISWTSRHI